MMVDAKVIYLNVVVVENYVYILILVNKYHSNNIKPIFRYRLDIIFIKQSIYIISTKMGNLHCSIFIIKAKIKESIEYEH